MEPLIDTHQHLWEPCRFSYAWMEPFPSLRRRSLLEEYRAASSGSQIAGTVYVDPDVDASDLPAEVAAVFELADNPSYGILGVVPEAKLETANPRAHLQPYRDHGGSAALRRTGHSQLWARDVGRRLAGLHVEQPSLIVDRCVC